MSQKAEFCNIGGQNIPVYLYKSVIVGSGCAGLNCADTLFDLGCESVAVITNGLFRSTSINTGSDKQTYYKLSTAGDESDSIFDMATTLFSGGCMQGYHSLTEAANSLKCFYKLVSLGVDFPRNEFGEYVGYRTDHDYRKRATSCGPLTSNFMANALIKSVKSKNIDVHENLWASKLITENGKIRGVICVDINTGELSVFMASSVVLATGGPSGIYHSSVYPKSHNGSLGLAMEAGCTAVNLTEWQYGIASTDFRWNLSGSYMQVIPRFVSVDKNGVEREFLSDYIGDERYTLIFQKGYNWPFCPSKLCGDNKSSLIDIAVYKETCKGRKVYLDFTKNDSGYSPELLSSEAREYLDGCGVLDIDAPIDKLIAMNERAYKLYLDKAGIDLKTTALAIDVCAQHCNGGIDCDSNYMTCIEGLYAAGECAGVFGVARPGGTALNSTQVSSMRAAEHIVKSNRREVCLTKNDIECIKAFAGYCTNLLKGSFSASDIFGERRCIGESMSKNAAFVRSMDGLIDTYKTVEQKLESFEAHQAVCDKSLLAETLINKDILVSCIAVLSAMICYSQNGFASRGSFMVTNPEDCTFANVDIETDTETIIKIKYADGKASAYFDKVKPVPQSEQWFENVYNSYYNDK